MAEFEITNGFNGGGEGFFTAARRRTADLLGSLAEVQIPAVSKAGKLVTEVLTSSPDLADELQAESIERKRQEDTTISHLQTLATSEALEISSSRHPSRRSLQA